MANDVNAQRAACPVALSYFGGKFNLSKELVRYIPPHENYIELFAGGLSMFFRKEKANWNLVNDLNQDIANLYLVLSNPRMFEDFMNSAYWLVNSRLIYDSIKAEIERTADFRPVSVLRAVYYYFYVSTCFNNIIGSGMSTEPSNWNLNIINSLKLSRLKLDGVYVENRSYEDIIDRFWDKDNTFWYLDPPYVVADKMKYYKHNFTPDEHKKLKEYVDKINANKTSRLMISYDNIPEIRELYKDYFVKEIATKYTEPCIVKDATELLITNYDISKMFPTQESLF